MTLLVNSSKYLRKKEHQSYPNRIKHNNVEKKKKLLKLFYERRQKCYKKKSYI